MARPIHRHCVAVAAMAAVCSCSKRPSDVELHPDFRVVEGKYDLTTDWSVALPGKFNLRMDGRDLVFWRPGISVWTAVWDNNKNFSKEERLEGLLGSAGKGAYDKKTERSPGLVLCSYRLDEKREDERRLAFYCFAIGKNGHVRMSMLFDTEDDLKTAEAIWRSCTEVPTDAKDG